MFRGHDAHRIMAVLLLGIVVTLGAGIAAIDGWKSWTLRGQVTGNNCQGFWKLNEGNGATAIDALPSVGGDRHDGTINNGTWNGADLEFNGADTAVTIPDVTSPTGPMTIALWARTDRTDWNAQGSGCSGYGSYFTLAEFGDDAWWFGILKQGDTTGVLQHYPYTAADETFPINDGAYHHVAFTWDGTTGKLYQDGVVVKTGNSAPPTGGVGLGIGFNSCDTPWLGRIREVRLYSKALSADDITTLKNGGNVAFSAPSCSGSGGGGAVCGNGSVENGEQCDDGNQSNSDTCLNNCLNASCGDGYVRTSDGIEHCDSTSDTCPNPQTYICNAQCLCQQQGGGGSGGSGAVCGNGTVEQGEQCDGGTCCTASCTFLSNAAVCRAAAGACDAPESCTGTSTACPSDQMMPNSVVCRPSAGACDVPEACTGSGPTCPSDGFQPSSVMCRPAAGVCDRAEQCPGNGAACPIDAFQPSTLVCRPAAGVCDVEEKCSGSNAACPGNTFQPPTTVCRQPAGACDAVERCTGAAAACPSDQLTPQGTQCAAASPPNCPRVDCTGQSPQCPSAQCAQNRPPQIDFVPSSPRNKPLATVAPGTISIVAHDSDGDPLSYSATGLPPGLTINRTTGVITGTLEKQAANGGPQGFLQRVQRLLARLVAQVGGGGPQDLDGPDPAGRRYQVTVTVSDSRGGSTSRTFDWQVDPLRSRISLATACSCYESSHACDQHLFNDSTDPIPDLTVQATLNGVTYGGDMMPSHVYPVGPNGILIQQAIGNGTVTQQGNQVRWTTPLIPPQTDFSAWPLIDPSEEGGSRTLVVHTPYSINEGPTGVPHTSPILSQCVNKVVDPVGPICKDDGILYIIMAGHFNVNAVTVTDVLDPCLDPSTVTALMPPTCVVQGNTVRCNDLPINIDMPFQMVSFMVWPKANCPIGTVIKNKATLSYPAHANVAPETTAETQNRFCSCGDKSNTCLPPKTSAGSSAPTLSSQGSAPSASSLSLSSGASVSSPRSGSSLSSGASVSSARSGSSLSSGASVSSPRSGSSLSSGASTSGSRQSSSNPNVCSQVIQGNAAVFCSQTNGAWPLLCSPAEEFPVTTTGIANISLQYDVPTSHCTSVRLHARLDGQQAGTTPVLGFPPPSTGGPGGAGPRTATLNLGLVQAGTHTVSLQAESIGDGCAANVGLVSWGGPVTITVTYPVSCNSMSSMSSIPSGSSTSGSSRSSGSSGSSLSSGASTSRTSSTSSVGSGSAGSQHAECDPNNPRCISVAGGGPGVCSNNPQCAESHATCRMGQCMQVPGPGPSECAADSQCLNVHAECNASRCALIPGGGFDFCTINVDCTLVHAECRNKRCVQVPGPGPSLCSPSTDCSQVHAVCIGNQCKTVAGPGNDACGLDRDCGGGSASSVGSGASQGSGMSQWSFGSGASQFSAGSQWSSGGFGPQASGWSMGSAWSFGSAQSIAIIGGDIGGATGGTIGGATGGGFASESRQCLTDTQCASGRICLSGGCVSCGDGIVSPPEVCDDGNKVNTDACTNRCAYSVGQPCARRDDCGSGVCVAGTCQACGADSACGQGERCVSGACIATLSCRFDDDCPGNDLCLDNICAACGDGIVTPPELCDDANRRNGDGCSDRCRPDRGAPTAPLAANAFDLPFVPSLGALPGFTGQSQGAAWQPPFPGSWGDLRQGLGVQGSQQGTYPDGSSPLMATARSRGPLSKQGPEAIAVMAAGSALGWVFMRRRKR